MVDLPKVPIPDTVTQPVRTSISSAEVAAPFAEIAHGLDKAGETLTEASVDLAQKAGEQAVRTDDAGNLVVDKAPLLVGPAAPAFARAARMTYAGKMQPQIENDLLQLRLAHPNDPQGFQTAATAYGKEKLDQIDDPTLKIGIGKMIGDNAAHNFRTSLIDANQQNTAEALQTYQARIKDINEKGATLARQPGGVEAPEYQGLAHDRMALYKELGDDPRFKFSPERAALEMRENRDQDVGQAVIGQAQRIFQTKRNAGEAQKFLQDAFWGPGSEGLNLSASKRDHFVAEGMHALANLSASDREAIAENRQAVNGYISVLRKDPSLFNDQQHNDLVTRAESIGDYKSLADLREARVWQPVWADFKKMSPADQATNLAKLSQGVIPDVESASFLRSRAVGGGVHVEGVSPQFATRLQTALADAEKATGETARIESLKRTTAEQSILYQRYRTGQGGLAAPPGYSRHEVGEAADIPNGKVLDFLHQNAGKYGLEFLKGSGFTNDPGHVQMAKGDVSLPQGAPQRIDLGADTPTTRLWQSTIADWRTSVSKAADVAYSGIVAKDKDRDTFAPGEVTNALQMATLSGRDDLVEKLKPIIAAQEIEGKIQPGEAAAVISQAEAAKASGVDPLVHAALEKVIQNTKAGEQALRENPLTESARRGWSSPINPLSPANPQAVAEIQQRQQSATKLQQHDPTHGPVSLIGKDEVPAIGAALTGGDPTQARDFLTALQTIPEGNRLPTMAALKDPIINMSRSNDPMRFGAGMTTLSTLWQTHKPEFEALFGGDAKTRMLAFQGLQGSLDVPAIIQRLNTADDPAMAKSRADIEEAVNKETKDWAPTDVAYQLGSSYGIPGTGFISRAIGSTPAVSTNELTAGEMKHDFIDTYKALREFGVAKDTAMAKAVEGLKSEWQVSQIGGNSLMKNAPEAHYPALAGNHDWMRTDLQDHIASILGPQVTMGDDGTFKQHWTFQGILSDPQTAREVKSPPPGPDGKPRGPSYQIVVQDDRGQSQILTQNGTISRFAWDPSGRTAMDTARAKSTFDARRSDIQAVQPYQGVTGPM